MRSMLLLWFVGLDIRVIFSGLQTRAQSNTAKHTQNTAQFFFFTLLCSVVLCVCEKYYCVLCDVVFCVVFSCGLHPFTENHTKYNKPLYTSRAQSSLVSLDGLTHS